MPTALITGTSTGLGRRTAELFLDRGWNVAATLRSPDRALAFADSDQLLVQQLDITRPDTIQAAVNSTLDRFGRIDALVNNAAFGGHFIFEQASDAVVREMFETNVFGTMNVCRAVLPHLRAQGSGAVVNVTSMAGMMVLPANSIYSATKYAVEAFTEGLAIDYKPFGITARSVLPGAYPTEFNNNTVSHIDEGDAELVRLANGFRNKMGKVVGAAPQDPAEVAELVFACATEADMPTHNPCGADARMLVGMMEQGSRDQFLDQLTAMLAPEFD